MHPRVAVEVPRVKPFQESGLREVAPGPSDGEPSQEEERDQEREPPGDVVSRIEAHEVKDARGGRLEVRGRGVVLLPVQGEVGPEDAPAGDGDDMSHVAEQPRVPQEADDAEVEQGGPQAAAGEGESESWHDRETS
jgi:hypothetical protein